MLKIKKLGQWDLPIWAVKRLAKPISPQDAGLQDSGKAVSSKEAIIGSEKGEESPTPLAQLWIIFKEWPCHMISFSVPISLKNEEFVTLQTRHIIPKNMAF